MKIKHIRNLNWKGRPTGKATKKWDGLHPRVVRNCNVLYILWRLGVKSAGEIEI
jgi:hypothetical protein